MKQNSLRKSTGLLLIVTPIMLNVLFMLLDATFDYPDILRMPTEEVLGRFQTGGNGLIAIWYAMTITAAFFIPIVLSLHKLLTPQDSPTIFFAAIFGVSSGGRGAGTRLHPLALSHSISDACLLRSRLQRIDARLRRVDVPGLQSIFRGRGGRAFGLFVYSPMDHLSWIYDIEVAVF